MRPAVARPLKALEREAFLVGRWGRVRTTALHGRERPAAAPRRGEVVMLGSPAEAIAELNQNHSRPGRVGRAERAVGQAGGSLPARLQPRERTGCAGPRVRCAGARPHGRPRAASGRDPWTASPDPFRGGALLVVSWTPLGWRRPRVRFRRSRSATPRTRLETGSTVDQGSEVRCAELALPRHATEQIVRNIGAALPVRRLRPDWRLDAIFGVVDEVAVVALAPAQSLGLQCSLHCGPRIRCRHLS